MQLTLFDKNPALCEALETQFAGCENVSVQCSDLRDLPPHNCLVTAGNSYGIMDGGIDFAVRDMFGVTIQDVIQWGIVEHYGGRMPVGVALSVETGDPRFPKLIYLPTMERPARLTTGDVYHLFYTLMYSIHTEDTVACPGLGTGAGGVRPDDAVRMTREAYDEFSRRHTVK